MLLKVNYIRVIPEVTKNILLLAQHVCRVEGEVYAFESIEHVPVNINHRMGVHVQEPLVRGKQPTHILYHEFIVLLWHTDSGGTAVKALCYKSEGRCFDTRWCHWNFSLT